MNIWKPIFWILALGAVSFSITFDLRADSGNQTAGPITLKEVTRIVYAIQNECDYMTDPEQYNEPDYAQDCRITKKGDCEDFTIAMVNEINSRWPGSAKVMAVRKLSIDRQTRKPTEGYHAVAFIEINGRTYVGDVPATSYKEKKYRKKYLVRPVVLDATPYKPSRIDGKLVYKTPTTFIVVRAS